MTEEKKTPALCGHVNKHHYNIKGQLSDLKCTLKKGHEGNHSASYEVMRDGEKTTEIAFWSDAAGVPVE